MPFASRPSTVALPQASGTRGRATPGPAPQLLAWFRRHRRQLPWRGPHVSAYAVWVSEIMLQQTRVGAVIPYYLRFVSRFPNLAALAAAREDEVLALWSGLGYYQRARRLRAAAELIVTQHGGELPLNWPALRALPGVGDYTAGAILSIAAGQPFPAVDGNVVRIAGRLAGRHLSPAVVRTWAQSQLPARRPGEFNQALMDLGAMICLPRTPRCGECPLRSHCDTRGELPARTPRPPARRVRVHYLLARHRGRILLRQRPVTARRLPGLWELPEIAQPRQKPVITVRHTITRFAIRASLHIASGKLPAGVWFSPEDLQVVPLTGLTRKLLRQAAQL